MPGVTKSIILVSACLIGRPCRYDGRRAASRGLISMLSGRDWVAVCPEQLGGLPTPRAPARLEGGDGGDVLDGRARVINSDGADVTEAYVRGAETILDLAGRLGVSTCCLKDRSPSCGVSPSWDNNGKARGQGVLAALMSRSGFKLVEIISRTSE